MNDESPRQASEPSDDRIAERAASYDEAIAAGHFPDSVPIDDPEALSALTAAQASLRMLERVWPRSAPAAPATGARQADAVVFGRFQIVRELGQGGFGVVFLARDPDLGRFVALKVPRGEMLLDPEPRKRFVREARAAASLDHPNIVPLFEAGEVGPICYLASAWCEGPSLSAWLRERREPVPPRQAAQVLASLADAIQHAHDRGVLHRDLKPSNVLLQQSPDGGSAEFSPRIIDFGLARLMDGSAQEATVSFAAMGSAPFMSPEQVEGGRVGPATDVYGLGTILYSLLCGQAPHQGKNNPDILRRVLADEVVPPRRRRPEVPRALEAICLKCLEKAPSRRYPSARELADDLGRFLAGKPIQARAQGRWGSMIRISRDRLTFMGVVGGLVVGTWFWAGERPMHVDQPTAPLPAATPGEIPPMADRLDRQRRLQYVGDIRHADQLIRGLRGSLADEVLKQHLPRSGEPDLREFCWYELMRRCHTEFHTLSDHAGDVYFAEFSHRGDLLATAGKDGKVVVRRTNDWSVAHSFRASDAECNAAVFSPDDKTLATVDDEGKLKLWTVATERCLWERPAHQDDAALVQFSSDGRRILTSGRSDGLVKIWDVSTGASLGGLDGYGCLFSPDGSTLAAFGSDGRIILYEWESRKVLGSLPGTPKTQDAAFSHDGTKLAIASESDELARVWDVSSGRIVHEFHGHIQGVFAVAFTGDDRALVTAGQDGTIRFWDVVYGRKLRVHQGHAGKIWRLAVAPDGASIVSAGQDGATKIWDAHPDPDVPGAPLRIPGDSFAFSRNGRELLVHDRGPVHSLTRWDATRGEPLGREEIGSSDAPAWTVLLAHGEILASVTQGRNLVSWDRTAGQSATISDHAFKTSYPIVSPDSQYLAVARLPAGWSIWDVARRRLAPCPVSAYSVVGFRPSGEAILSREDGEARLWKPGNAGIGKLLPGRLYPAPTAVSPDGRIIAAIDPRSSKILFLSSDSLEPRAESPGHLKGTTSMSFSPDGTTLASTGLDGFVRIWDVTTGDELLNLERLPKFPYFPQFSPDGDKLAVTVPEQSRVWVWGPERRMGTAEIDDRQAKGGATTELRGPRSDRSPGSDRQPRAAEPEATPGGL